MRARAWLIAALCGCAAVPAFAGGLAVSPSIVEHTATPGPVGSIAVINGTAAAIKITVTPRPWLQARDGRVVADRRHTLKTWLRLSAPAFTLAPGARRSVDVALLRTPGSGSLYGNIEVVGTPKTQAKPGRVRLTYRLVNSLRLNPSASRRRLRLEVGDPALRGRGRSATAVVAVRNAGNTVDPITGDVRISGPRGTVNEAVGSVRVLPGAIVDVALGSVSALPRGSYRVALSLRQAGRVVAKVSRRLSVR